MAPTGNWYFMFVSTFLLVALGTWVTENVIEKNLGPYTGKYVVEQEEITELQNRGLRNAGIALLVYF